MIPALSAALAVVLAAVSVALGERVRRRARVPLAPALRLPVAYLLGSWLLALALLLVGLARLLVPAAIIAVVVAAAIGGSWRGWRFGWGGLLAGASGSAMLLPVALAPPFFYDALVYHLALPWQALLEGRWAPHPENLFSTAPPLSQLLALPALAAGLERAPALQHLVAGAIAGAAVWALARSLGAARWAATLAAASVSLLPSHAAVAGLPAAEAWAWAALAAALAVALGPRRHGGELAIAGVLAGVACAARVQAVPLALLIVAAGVLRRPTWGATGRALGGLAAGSAPWWLKNLCLLGSPLAPLGWPVAGEAALHRDAVSLLHVAGSPLGAARVVAGALAPHAAYLLPLALGVAFALLGRTRVRLRIAAAVVCGGFLGWLAVGAVPRYLGAALVLALAVVAGLARRRDGAVAAALVLGTVAALSVAFSLLEVRRLGGLDLLRTPAAAVQDFWVVNNPLPAYAEVAALPPDARLLLVGEPRGYGLPRRFVAPSYYDVSPLRAWIEAAAAPGQARASLCRAGFTHLLVNHGELRRLTGGYPAAPWASAEGEHRWRALVAELGPPVLDRGPVSVYRLGYGTATAEPRP